LQNAFDLIVLSALIDFNDMINKVAPALGYFVQAEDGYEPERYLVPRHVESVLNTKWVGSRLAVGVGGGVGIDARSVVRSVTGKHSEKSKLSGRRQRAPLVDTSADRWWAD
jgi:hypothetical protein